MWFLNATCEIPEAEPNTEPVDFLGIDLGIVNIATTSDGEIMAGRELNRIRLRERGLRAKLQKKNTPCARRRLNKRRRKEARRAKDINHKIANMWWPRQNAPVAESPSRTSRASANGYGVRHEVAHNK
jgi:transposase